jgi:hypothetical protein
LSGTNRTFKIFKSLKNGLNTAFVSFKEILNAMLTMRCYVGGNWQQEINGVAT